jgi:hypothetical protein
MTSTLVDERRHVNNYNGRSGTLAAVLADRINYTVDRSGLSRRKLCLAAGIEALSDRRLLVVRDAGHPSTNLRRACAAIARATCAPAYAPGVALELYEFLRMGID